MHHCVTGAKRHYDSIRSCILTLMLLANQKAETERLVRAVQYPEKIAGSVNANRECLEFRQRSTLTSGRLYREDNRSYETL